MTRYHVNPESQRPNICRAKIRCDFAVDGQEPPHFETKEEARKHAEGNMTEEFGETSKIVKADKPKKLTKAQKEREEGAAKAKDALGRGMDPDTLLKYANNHDAWAKGYTAELKRASEEKKNLKSEIDEKKADLKNLEMEWSGADEADIPAIEKEMNDVRGEIDELEAKSNTGKKTEKTDNVKKVERTKIETTASSVRAGDVLSGQKFTESGKWVDNDHKVAKVEHATDLDWKTRVTVTYDDGRVAEYTGKAEVTVKRDKNIAPDKPASVIRTDLKNVTKNVEKNGIINHREAYTVLNSLNNHNATMHEALRAKKLSDMLEDSGQYDPSIKIDAATARIKMNHDSNYKIDPQDAFSLLYDEERTDPELVEKLKKDFPTQAENATKNRGYRKEINERNGEVWV